MVPQHGRLTCMTNVSAYVVKPISTMTFLSAGLLMAWNTSQKHLERCAIMTTHWERLQTSTFCAEFALSLCIDLNKIASSSSQQPHCALMHNATHSQSCQRWFNGEQNCTCHSVSWLHVISATHACYISFEAYCTLAIALSRSCIISQPQGNQRCSLSLTHCKSQ